MKTNIHGALGFWFWSANARGWNASSSTYTRRHDAIRGLARFLERVRAK